MHLFSPMLTDLLPLARLLLAVALVVVAAVVIDVLED